MYYFCISWSHKNTELNLREKFAFPNDKLKEEFLAKLLKHPIISEIVLTSTCNRVEFFCFVKDKNKAGLLISEALGDFFTLSANALYQRADLFEDNGAIHHIFSVASSLDSLVVGETQIVGQLKEAFLFSLEREFCAIHLSKAIHYAFKCAAKVRTLTEISKNPISIASVAVAKAKELLNLEGRKVVVIGAGMMSELACKHLLSAKAQIILLNRNFENAKELAKKLDKAVEIDSFEKLSSYLNKYEVFFSSTNAPHYIITNDLLLECEFKRYFFDIAVPRDINLSLNEKVEVFSVDDLQEVVQKNLALREEQAKIAYKIIGSMTAEFFKQLNELTLSPLIKALRLQAQNCAEFALKKALHKGYLKKSDADEAKKLIHQVFQAFLHRPTIKLKELEGQIQSQSVAEALNYVFELDKSSILQKEKE